MKFEGYISDNFVHGNGYSGPGIAGAFRTDDKFAGGGKRATLIIHDEQEIETLYQWAYRNSRGDWQVCKFLRSEEYVRDNWKWEGAEYIKIQGPFRIRK